jgi:hypothetical protein
MKDLPTFSEDCFVGGMYINGASNLFHGPELDHSNFEIYKNLATSRRYIRLRLEEHLRRRGDRFDQVARSEQGRVADKPTR